MVGPRVLKSAVKYLVGEGLISERHGCRLLGVSRSCVRYELQDRPWDSLLRARILDLANAHPRFGCPRITALLRREFKVNAKKVHRLWKEEGLIINRRKSRKRGVWERSKVLAKSEHANHVWSYDFMEDQMVDGGWLRILNILDEYTREGLCIRIGRHFDHRKVIATLEDLFIVRGVPHYLRSDNGPEFIANAIKSWLTKQGCQTLYIEPGSPWENAHIESFNGKLRDEFLNMNSFSSVREAQVLADAWLREYNEIRPHSSLGYQTPAAFAAGSGSSATGFAGPSLRFQNQDKTVINL
jgi:transposase InsO family protein